jgi:hypothetical protein
MLQYYVLSVLNVSEAYFICVFRTHVTVVLSGCCIYFTYMLHEFYLVLRMVVIVFKCVSGVFFSGVSEACFKCFNCL